MKLSRAQRNLLIDAAAATAVYVDNWVEVFPREKRTVAALARLGLVELKEDGRAILITGAGRKALTEVK